MTQKEKYIAILKTLDNLSVQGSPNILTMYNLISFIQNELQIIDKQEKELVEKSKQPPKEVGGL